MRHYEIVIMVHPDQSEQAPAMVEKYLTKIKEEGGKIHRHEDWGRRALAYPIEGAHKAHYVLLNVELEQNTLDELDKAFRYNDAIIRTLVVKMDAAVTHPSPFGRKKDEREPRRERDSERDSERETDAA